MNTAAAAVREDARDEFSRVAERLPGANLPWLARARRRAVELFAASGLPGARDEEWKYTSVAPVAKHVATAGWAGAAPHAHGSLAAARVLVERCALAAESAADEAPAHLLVFLNGRHEPALSAPGCMPDGATLGSLAAALRQKPEMLEPFFVDEAYQTVFAALNSAFMAEGAFLHLSCGCVLDAPVHLLFVATAGDAAASWSAHLRNLIVAEEGAQATVIEHYVGGDGAAYWTNAVTRIHAAAQARIEHYKLQQEAADALHIAALQVRQERASGLVSHSIALGAALTRNDLGTTFVAPGCEATLNGLYLGSGRQHIDNHTRIDHAAPSGTSREFYRGVLDGRARAVFNGKVVVHPDAQQSDAYQANHNLLLSRDAEVDTKPQLEIHADDVKCTHGATVGQIDDEQVFYLRARGIEEAMARSLLVHAFAHDVIARIGLPALRGRLERILFARLPQGERIRALI